ncbi:MAG: hypothetical protein AAB449_02965 [Patescibacteria group bacterium]
MIDIVPAVLPKSVGELTETLARLKGIASLIQIDLVGENVLAESEAVPQWEEFDFEFDLMTHDSLQDARSAVSLGATRVVIHSDFPKAAEALEMLQQTRSGNYPVLVGVALPCVVEPAALDDFAGLYDFVQVMGIAEVGAQGRPFDARALTLVSALRATHPKLLIQVDGAVAGHAKELVAAGANRLVAGSAIVNADDPKKVYTALYNSVNGILA